MAYYINNLNQKIAYKYTKGKSPGIVFIHGLNSDMQGLKALTIEKYAKKIIYLFLDLIVGGTENPLVNLKISQYRTGKKILLIF